MAYRKEKGTLTSTDGRTVLSTTTYYPEGTPKGIIQLSHGMCEYVERYESFETLERITADGWILAGHDHKGHGYSAASPEDLGWFAEKDGWSILVKDVLAMTASLKARFPGLPIVLWGHSMGSFIAREVLRQGGSEYAGAIICGTAGPNPAAGAGIVLANLVAKVKGSRYRSAFLNSMAFGSYNKRFEGRTPYDWLTRETSVVDKYAKDPFCTYLFTASGFRDLFTLLKRVSAKDWAPSVPKDLPMFLIAGAMDPVGDYGKGVQTVYDSLKAAGCGDVSLKLYPDCRHEIHNETDREEVYADLLAFADRVIG